MNLYQAELFLKKELNEVYDAGEAVAIADLALEQISGWGRTERLLKKETDLGPKQLLQLHEYRNRLLQHEPIQYITHKAWFYGLELYVDEGVLIPRPETEELVNWILQDQKKILPEVFEKKQASPDETTKLKLLDVGTGSGCIALALKKQMPLAEIWGCDVSDRALNIARRNAATLDIRVDFEQVDFLDTGQQKHLPTVDLVVSNPPYIPVSDINSMLPNVVRYEPHTALFVPDNDPLVFYRALATFGKHRLYESGSIYMEIHEELGQQVMDLFKMESYEDIEVRKDMQGKFRMVKVRKGKAGC